MDGGDIMLSVLIISIFASLQLFNIMAIGIKNIKDNWSLYKCNPIFIPFASVFGHDPGKTFTFCMQNMNMNFMTYLLDPLQYLLNNIADEGEYITKHFGGMLGLSTGIITAFRNILVDGWAALLNLYVIIHQIIIKTRDTFNKLIGVITSILYILGGLQYTATSVWAGPIGGFTRAVAGLV